MPSHKSAVKRMRTSERSRIRNKAKKTRMKTLIKQLKSAETKEQAQVLYKKITSHLDRISTKGVVHPNQAARQKSRLAKMVNAMEAQG